MRRIISTAIALGAALAAAGCGSNEEAEPAATEQADTADAVDPNNPFAAAEKKMNDEMMAAVGTDVGDSWVRKMIVHHQGAIDMSRIGLQQNVSDHVRQMAQESIDKQSAEVEALRKLVKEGSPNPQSGQPFQAAMTEMQQEMMAASGADISETFMRKMLAHHEGGVALSDAALASGVTGAVREQVNKTRAGQQEEAEMTRAMLNGEPMPSATRASAAEPAAPAPAATSRPAPARSTPSPRPTQTPTPEPAAEADEHAGHNMSGQ